MVQGKIVDFWPEEQLKTGGPGWRSKSCKRVTERELTMNPMNGIANGSVANALARAVSLHLEGKRAEALQELKGAASHAGETAEFASAMGHIQFELEQYEDAARAIQAPLDRSEAYGRTVQSCGLPGKFGRWEDAAERFTKVLETSPTRTEARLGLAICQLHLEKSEAALENFDRVLAEDPANETALFGKAVGLQLTWRFDEATDIYKRVLSRQ